MRALSVASCDLKFFRHFFGGDLMGLTTPKKIRWKSQNPMNIEKLPADKAKLPVEQGLGHALGFPGFDSHNSY